MGTLWTTNQHRFQQHPEFAGPPPFPLLQRPVGQVKGNPLPLSQGLL